MITLYLICSIESRKTFLFIYRALANEITGAAMLSNLTLHTPDRNRSQVPSNDYCDLKRKSFHWPPQSFCSLSYSEKFIVSTGTLQSFFEEYGWKALLTNWYYNIKLAVHVNYYLELEFKYRPMACTT